ncbi:hypothetical protein [Noviherbaspirillum galbum]|uniref:Uncharacterized protein n=1 Tax=Noviherbaspirillum galbum TaxID=2709383 RepID=A0A6B3SUF2_9BURK|nr:hypothetical protein [Noviherbaspirillum galbum]NEX64108.1 hypothetical protein [Noviherbaspirillum galbum]
MMHEHDSEEPVELSEKPWISLGTTYDVEAWIDSYNRDLRRVVVNPRLTGYGICFSLGHGGDIYLHTDAEGNVVLDVTEEADWVTPLLTAATGVAAPAGRIWTLPGDRLTQLVLGLDPLIARTRLVLAHDFRMKKGWQ